jgi:signal transduction histidine kinase
VWGYARTRQEAAALARKVSASERATAALMHDLKQPLSVISALAAAIRAREEAGFAAPSPELLARIEEQVQTALTDIDELLLVAPGREITLQRERFDLAAVAEGGALAQSLKSPGHEVEVRAPSGGVWVSADPRHVARALNNLIDNAIKYWPEGGTVQVVVDPTPRLASVRVTDQGLGMSREQLSRIFTEYGRAVPDGVDIPGTGLGLFSAKRVMEAHGGTITVESEPGVGSTFQLSVPYVPTAATAS